MKILDAFSFMFKNLDRDTKTVVKVRDVAHGPLVSFGVYQQQKVTRVTQVT